MKEVGVSMVAGVLSLVVAGVQNLGVQTEEEESGGMVAEEEEVQEEVGVREEAWNLEEVEVQTWVVVEVVVRSLAVLAEAWEMARAAVAAPSVQDPS